MKGSVIMSILAYYDHATRIRWGHGGVSWAVVLSVVEAFVVTLSSFAVVAFSSDVEKIVYILAVLAIAAYYASRAFVSRENRLRASDDSRRRDESVVRERDVLEDRIRDLADEVAFLRDVVTRLSDNEKDDSENK